MKKALFVALMAVASIAIASAQPRAIGGNIGGGIGFSYEHGFGEANMLDVAASFPLFGVFGNEARFGIMGHVTYDWIDPFNAPVPWNEKGEWHWYMGVGGAGGAYSFKDGWWYVGAAGHIGIEYDFWCPLQLSVDYRPSIGITNGWRDENKVHFDDHGFYGISIGVRYKF